MNLNKLLIFHLVFTCFFANAQLVLKKQHTFPNFEVMKFKMMNGNINNYVAVLQKGYSPHLTEVVEMVISDENESEKVTEKEKIEPKKLEYIFHYQHETGLLEYSLKPDEYVISLGHDFFISSLKIADKKHLISSYSFDKKSVNLVKSIEIQTTSGFLEERFFEKDSCWSVYDQREDKYFTTFYDKFLQVRTSYESTFRPHFLCFKDSMYVILLSDNETHDFTVEKYKFPKQDEQKLEKTHSQIITLKESFSGFLTMNCLTDNGLAMTFSHHSKRFSHFISLDATLEKKFARIYWGYVMGLEFLPMSKKYILLSMGSVVYGDYEKVEYDEKGTVFNRKNLFTLFDTKQAPKMLAMVYNSYSFWKNKFTGSLFELYSPSNSDYRKHILWISNGNKEKFQALQLKTFKTNLIPQTYPWVQ